MDHKFPASRIPLLITTQKRSNAAKIVLYLRFNDSNDNKVNNDENDANDNDKSC